MEDNILQAVDPQRLIDTAKALIAVPSPTLDAGAAADALASILVAEGFAVERPQADWPQAPAVVARLDSGQPGRVLQFDGALGHGASALCTAQGGKRPALWVGCVRHEGGDRRFRRGAPGVKGCGRTDPRGGLDCGPRPPRSTLGRPPPAFGPDPRRLCRRRVLLPEYLGDALPVAGRGLAVFSVEIERDGAPVHEVLRPAGLPDVIAAGAEVVLRLNALNEHLRVQTAPYVGSDTCLSAESKAASSTIRCRSNAASKGLAAG